MTVRSALIALALLALVVAACDGNDESSSESTTSSSPRSTDPVVEFYDALNLVDVERIMVVWPTADREALEVMTEAFRVKVSVACSPEGDAGSVRCDETVGNHDFYTPAGLAVTYTVIYTIEDGVIVDREVVASPEPLDQYDEAFGAWLETADPNIYASYQAGTPYLFDTAGDALSAVARVDEFLAQSDDYPVQG